MINNSININKVNNHLSPKESLNSDDQQLYQYQQSEQSTCHLKKALNSDDQQLYQYQQSEQPPVT